MTVEYTPRGVCSRHMQVSAEDGVITDVQISGGCNGNLKGIMSLLKGMKVTDAIDRLRGIHCGPKDTSCPDQLSIALGQLLDK